MSWDTEAFKEKLVDQHTFPGQYLFKFIVPQAEVTAIMNLQVDGQFSQRPSSNGKYVSVSIQAFVTSPEQIIDVYRHASGIKGCIAL